MPHEMIRAAAGDFKIFHLKTKNETSKK